MPRLATRVAAVASLLVLLGLLHVVNKLLGLEYLAQKVPQDYDHGDLARAFVVGVLGLGTLASVQRLWTSRAPRPLHIISLVGACAFAWHYWPSSGTVSYFVFLSTGPFRGWVTGAGFITGAFVAGAVVMLALLRTSERRAEPRPRQAEPQA